MDKYSIINYRLNKSVKPIDVLRELECLMSKNHVAYSECLLKIGALIVEYEHDGKWQSNRQKNAILTILKRYPELNGFFTHQKQENEDGLTKEMLIISNYLEETLLSIGKIDYSLAKQISEKIPTPYGVNDFKIIFSGIVFDNDTSKICLMKSSSSGFDSPVGNYISYSRSNYGDEKHSHIHFSVDDNNLKAMRKLFFEFCEKISGKYEGTEYHA